MRRTSFGAAAVVAYLAATVFSTPASTQGRPGRRLEIEQLNGWDVAAREVLFRFQQDATKREILQIASEADAERIDAVGRAGVLRVRSQTFGTETLLALLSARPNVAYVEPNFVVRAAAQPNDPRFPELWGLLNIGQGVNGRPPGLAGADIHAPDAWEISTGSAAPVVGVVDTGIDYTHPDLAANIWAAPTAFTVTIDGEPITCPAGSHGFNAIARSCSPMDDHNHGTHVAGTIGAVGNNGVGVSGVNWTSRLMGLKFLDQEGTGTVADAIAAIDFAIQAKQFFAASGGANVRVLSNSWGDLAYSQALLEAINAANDSDMLFVAAAGNYGLSNDMFPMYPASYDAPNVVSVLATTNADQRASFSNYGATTVHVGAPGVDILSTVVGGSYAFLSGTSMAAPHVSGAASLVLSQCALSTADLKSTLLATVQPVSALATTTITGGRLDANSAMYGCVAPPNAPTLSGQPADGRVLLSWSSALGAMRYQVKRSQTAGGPYAVLAANVQAAQYIDTAVMNDTTYYYVVAAANTLGESGDSNEVTATPRAPSDLVVSSMTSPLFGGAGSTIVVSATTSNQGAGIADPTTTRFYLSNNAALDASDPELTPPQSVPTLAPGSASAASSSLTIPISAPVGQYYLFAKADADNVMLESQEANNTRVKSLQIGPDLVISALTVPATGAAGGPIAVTDTVKNQGGGAAGASTTRFHLSTNAILDAGDVPLTGGRAVLALASNATSTGSTVLTLPATLTVGTYFVIAKADGDGAVVETQEGNNSQARSIRVGGDLVVSLLTVPTKGGAGASLVVSDTTSNQGSGSIGASVTRFYLSANAALDAGDADLGVRAVPDLPAGSGSGSATTVTIPSGVTAGSYYIIAMADADLGQLETQETNNATARYIAIGPDLRISSTSAPLSVAAGSSISVAETVLNQGGGAGGVSTTRFYLSLNAALDAGDTELGGARSVPVLAAGASSAGSTGVTIPAGTPTGGYYLLVVSDADNAVGETIETNNVGFRSLQVTP